MLRNGVTDTAVVLKDGSVFELKRDGRTFNYTNRGERRTFADADAWRASLSVDSTAELVSTTQPKPKASLTSRVFQYTADVPHSQIAVDLLKHFKSNTHCRVDSLKVWQQELVKVKIDLLMLELDPPEIDRTVFASTTTVENVKPYYENWMTACKVHIAELSKSPNSTVYHPVIARYNPKVFVKCSDPDEMVPLGVHEASGHIVLNGAGFKNFADAAPCGSDGLPEFWVLWRNKMTKLNVCIASQVPEPCVMLPFEHQGVSYMRLGRLRDNFWSSGDLWENNNGVKGAYVGCLQQDGGINGAAESVVWARERGPQWQASV